MDPNAPNAGLAAAHKNAVAEANKQEAAGAADGQKAAGDAETTAQDQSNPNAKPPANAEGGEQSDLVERQRHDRERMEQEDRDEEEAERKRQAERDQKPKSNEERIAALEHEIGVLKNSPPAFGAAGNDQAPVGSVSAEALNQALQRIAALEGTVSKLKHYA